MKRSIKFIAIPLIIMIVAAVLMVPGCKKKQGPVDYFPLGMGSYWEYNVWIQDIQPGALPEMGKSITRVIGKEKVGDRESYVVDQYVLGQIPSYVQVRENYVKTEKGIECVKRTFPILVGLKQIFPDVSSEIVLSPPEEKFRNSMKENESWNWEGITGLEPKVETTPEGTTDTNRQPRKPEILEIKGESKYTYLGMEKIKVMNQEMECMKLKSFGKAGGTQENDSMSWFAPNIGLVRREQKVFIGSRETRLILEITNYNVINEEPFQWK